MLDKYGNHTGNLLSVATTTDCCVRDRKGTRLDDETRQLIQCLDAPEFIRVNRHGGFPRLQVSVRRGEPLSEN